MKKYTEKKNKYQERKLFKILSLAKYFFFLIIIFIKEFFFWLKIIVDVYKLEIKIESL